MSSVAVPSPVKTVLKYVRDVAAQLLHVNRIVARAFTDPKSEAAVVLGVVVSAATYAAQGHFTFATFSALVASFFTRPAVTPVVDEVAAANARLAAAGPDPSQHV